MSSDGWVFETVRTSVALIILVVFLDCIGVSAVRTNNDVVFPPEAESLEDDGVSHLAESKVWTAWSQWTDCSRTCDHGVRYRVRRCLGRKCEGRSKVYELCNTEPCTGNDDFRAMQCAQYNNRTYGEKILDEWVPAENRQQPCALTCRAKAYGFTVKYLSKVIDGTRCNRYNRDICVDGRCVTIGCDKVLNSKKKLDDCGVCGGNGSSCGRLVYEWKDTYQFSECIQTCGADSWRVSVSACINAKTGRMVPENLCADKERPRPHIQKCPHEPCPEEWEVGLWLPCNVTCGGGLQTREVFCAERYNGTRGAMEMRKVAEKYCWRNKKPDDWRQCNTHGCPVWENGEWSTCSVTCGKGVQYRKVACQQERYTELSAFACDPKQRPEEQRPCYAGLSCEEAERNRLLDYERYRYVAAAPYAQWGDDAGGDRSRGALPKPRWSKGPWKECSATCGPGVQNRQVKCVALQPFTQTVMVLPAVECEDQVKPPEFQPCEMRQCPRTSLAAADGLMTPLLDNRLIGTSDFGSPISARWEYGEWDKCSATCLGGYQSRTLKCVNLASNQEVAWANCNAKQRPVNVTRQCSTEPCPPQWQVGQYSVCSHTCGGGVRTRQVRCVQIHKSGDVTNTLFLADDQCSVSTSGGERPRNEEACAMENCPPYWSKGVWGECSRSCGEAQRYRMVVCEQLMIGGEIKRYNPPMPCQKLEKPPTVELCNYGVCPPPPLPIPLRQTLANGQQNLLHNDPTISSTEESRQEYRFRVGGEAKVYEGSRLKIKCPVKNFDRARIEWLKDNVYMKSTDNVKVSVRGTLRIANFSMSDVGVYTCMAGPVKGNITLRMKPSNDRMPPIGNNPLANGVGRKPVQNKPKINLKNHNGNNKTRTKDKSRMKSFTTTTTATTTSSSSIIDIDGYVVEPPQSPSSSIIHNVESPVLLTNTSNPHRLPLPDQLTRELVGLKTDGQQDRMLNPPSVTSSNFRPSMPLLEELKRYLLSQNKMETYQALTRVTSIASLKFAWEASEWSSCSRTCRQGTDPGMRTRAVKCKLRVDVYDTGVVDDICIRAGLPKPHEANVCGVEPCPQWVSGNWSLCSTGRCLRFQYAIQRRQSHCVFSNSTIAETSYCSEDARPSLKRECFNPRCVAEWRANAWSKCTKTCGNDGIEMRTLQCVWHGTRKPAGNSCRGDARPSTVRYCQEKQQLPCPTTAASADNSPPKRPPSGTEKCIDFSRYCAMAKTMGYCTREEYRERCCLSCLLLSDYKRHFSPDNDYLRD